MKCLQHVKLLKSYGQRSSIVMKPAGRFFSIVNSFVSKTEFTEPYIPAAGQSINVMFSFYAVQRYLDLRHVLLRGNMV